MNQVAKHWKDYECIDAGSGEKLERWKDIILRRPRSAGDLADGGKQHVEFTACTLPPFEKAVAVAGNIKEIQG